MAISQEPKKRGLFDFLEKKIIFQISSIFFFVILCFVLSCSKNAEVKGVVRDAGTEKGIEGVEVRALSDKLGKKIVAKTGKAGNYKLSLPPSEWAIHFNPKDCPASKKGYFSAFFTLIVYEKEKKTADTVWLIPYPPDSAPGSVYILDKGWGWRKIDGVTKRKVDWYNYGYWRYPSFLKIDRPYSLVFFDPKGKTEPCLVLCQVKSAHTSSGGIFYYMTGYEEQKISVMRAGNYSIIMLAGLSQGKYAFAFDISGINLGPAYLFEVPGPTSSFELPEGDD